MQIPDVFDRQHEDEYPSEPCCNRCGSTDVRWRQQSGRWVLFSLTPGVLHTCPINDPFEAVE